MGAKISAFAFGGALLLVTTLALGAGAPAAADSGGCPNQAAENGQWHADARSAHGAAKVAARGCASVDPTPPAPPPTDGADVVVELVTVSAPDSAATGEEFVVRVSGSLRNNGPADSVVVDTTFVLTAPSGCGATPAGPIVVENTTLDEGVGTGISRTWAVVCTQAGPAAFTGDVSVAIDPGEAVTDPDPSNNNGSGGDTTQIN